MKFKVNASRNFNEAEILCGFRNVNKNDIQKWMQKPDWNVLLKVMILLRVIATLELLLLSL